MQGDPRARGGCILYLAEYVAERVPGASGQ